LLSQFGKFEYALSDRYCLGFTIRRDGSSGLVKTIDMVFFLLLLVGWRINNEEILKNVIAVSNLKLRAGYEVEIRLWR
jgi:hypothetical protein